MVKIELCFETLDSDSTEYLLNENNYKDLIVSTYAMHGEQLFKLNYPFDMAKDNLPFGTQKLSSKIMKNEYDLYHTLKPSHLASHFPEVFPMQQKEIKKLKTSSKINFMMPAT